MVKKFVTQFVIFTIQCLSLDFLSAFPIQWSSMKTLFLQLQILFVSLLTILTSPSQARMVESSSASFPAPLINPSIMRLPHPSIQHRTFEIRGEKNKRYSGLKIRNPNGPCLKITNSQNIHIENSQIGPCGGAGIEIVNSQIVSIRETFISHTTGMPNIYARQSSQLEIKNNQLSYGSSGVYVEKGQQIQVNFNRIFNVQGPFPRGQFVQFNEVRGPRNSISCNLGENQLGSSNPEDAINLFKSAGSPDSYIEVYGNKIKGGGPSSSGGGIMTGDGGDSFFINVRKNILVNPGQYGIAAAGGHTIDIYENMVYAKSQPFTNVGIYVWDQYRSSCNNISVFSNLISWMSKDAQPNPLWSEGNCGPVGGWDSNNSQAPLDEKILDQPIPGC